MFPNVLKDYSLLNNVVPGAPGGSFEVVQLL